jgi:hypothetical protein
LEHAAHNIKTSSKNSSGGYFSATKMERQDPEILTLLETKANVDFNPPKTMAGVTKSCLLTKSAGGFIVLSTLLTCLYRLSLTSSSPLGIIDLFSIVGTRIFWDAQELAIHSRWFHGNKDHRAFSMFKWHDKRHDLPYYHLAVEPLKVAVVWWMAVFSLSKLSVSLLGVHPSIAATCLATYQASVITYSFMHDIVHTRVPLRGWLKRAKEFHIKHHISPAHHLNLGVHNIGILMKTDSYETRLSRAGLTVSE